MKAEGHAFWEEQRRRLYVRSGGRCEVGGCRLDDTGLEAHHRKLRSQGGLHGVENLLAACPAHHRQIHANPTWARTHGYIVPGIGDYDPAEWAVILHDGRTVRMTAAGGYDLVFPA